MNIWRCDHKGCFNEAVGVGGAIGLRAIGWYFHVGGPILCPVHRPDPIPCCDSHTPEDERADSCSKCTAEGEASYWQQQMEDTYGIKRPEWRVRPRLAPYRAETFVDMRRHSTS